MTCPPQACEHWGLDTDWTGGAWPPTVGLLRMRTSAGPVPQIRATGLEMRPCHFRARSLLSSRGGEAGRTVPTRRPWWLQPEVTTARSWAEDKVARRTQGTWVTARGGESEAVPLEHQGLWLGGRAGVGQRPPSQAAVGQPCGKPREEVSSSPPACSFHLRVPETWHPALWEHV